MANMEVMKLRLNALKPVPRFQEKSHSHFELEKVNLKSRVAPPPATPTFDPRTATKLSRRSSTEALQPQCQLFVTEVVDVQFHMKIPRTRVPEEEA